MNPADWVTVKRGGGMMGGGGSDFPQRLLAYDGSNNLIYIGIAPRGKLTSDSMWVIWKLSYDGSNNLITVQTSSEYSIWDNRATTVTYA